MSTFTPNIDLELVARNADVGTWDTPTNSNWSVTDLAVGGLTNISLNNTNVVLSAAQFQCKTISFNSTLTGNVTITFPTSYIKSYEIENTCTGSSAFTISLATASTAAGAKVVCAAPGETVEVFSDGANMKYKNLGRIGSYMEFCGSSAPLWVTTCSVPPYLNCDGSTFSSATYPALATFLGTTTLPDRRGVAGISLNQGTNRYTSAGSGMDGNTRFTVGGDQLSQSHTHTNTVGAESANHTHAMSGAAFFIGQSAGAAQSGGSFQAPSAAAQIGPNTGAESASHNHTVTINTAGSGVFQNVMPSVVYGICLIRAG